MATEKKTAAKTEAKAEVKAAPKAAAKTETKTEVKAAPKAAAKAAPKAEAKAAPKAEKKPAAAKKPAAKKADAKVDLFIEFGGIQVSVDEIIKNVKKASGKDAKSYTIYVKPEESKAYYVADGEEMEMDVFFV